MTASGCPASGAAPQRARNARSADGLANVAASNAGSGGRSRDRHVSETGTTSTTRPRASSCSRRCSRPPTACGNRTRVPAGGVRERRHQPLLPLLVVGRDDRGGQPLGGERARGRRARPRRSAPPRAPDHAPRSRARAQREPHRRRAGQHDPAVRAGARERAVERVPARAAARPRSSGRRRARRPPRAAPPAATPPGRPGG